MLYLRSHHVSIWKGPQITLKQIHTEIDRLVTALLREYSVNVGVKRKHSIFAIVKEKYLLIYLPDSIKEAVRPFLDWLTNYTEHGCGTPNLPKS